MHFHTIVQVGRFKDVVKILFKYGFEDLVKRLDLPGVNALKRIGHTHEDLGTCQRICRALEELGPTFVKFGQIMSMRPDLLPPELIRELTRLQDDVRPLPFETIRPFLEENLGRPIPEVFSILDTEPVAAASLSQVHRGVLREEGAIVCVKIQRPGIRPTIQTDLEILEAIAHRLHERSQDLQAYDLPNIVRVTRRNLMRELDFSREARNMRIARSHRREGKGLYVPQVYEAHCREQVLVMEYIQGTRLTEMDFSTFEGARALAEQGLHAAITQTLEQGFFHADPHPGNMIFSEEQGLCLLDWGMVGRLTEKDRQVLIDLLRAIMERDSDAMRYTLLRIARPEAVIDEGNLERELLDIIDAHYAVPVRYMNIGQLLLRITETVREYHMRLPSDLVIMVKALFTVEGTARRIYPELNILSEARGHVERLARKRRRPALVWREFRTTLGRILEAQRQVPSRVLQVIDRAERGELSLGFRLEHTIDLIQGLESSSNRLSFSIIIAALIIGSSMIITTGVGPFLFGYPAFGVIGYLISAVLGLWLVFTIIRTRKF